ncbi:hypothetical protein [Halomonas litopenaei]|uniref:hypothetical protein n=1 Tax=Halomonas litopenaei TaxID=2109328 RepID=UPI003F9F82B8
MPSNSIVYRSPFLRPRLATGLLWLLCLLPIAAQAAPLASFDARYHLAVDGWPDATVHHRVYREGDHWRSDMRAQVAIAEGQETARFTENGDGLRALGYSSGYRLLGIGKSYRLDNRQLQRHPDRQTALVDLSRSVQQQRCVSGCEIRYLDHKGDIETLVVTPLPTAAIDVDGRTVNALRVRLVEPGKDDRHMEVAFHPDLPGLLLGVDYTKRGEQVSRLSLTSLTTTDN